MGPVGSIPPAQASGWPTPPKKTMRAFRSDQEIASYFRELAEKQRLRAQRAPAQAGLSEPSAMPAPSADKEKAADDKDESVTNIQHAGVDEGGIVKLHGNHLVVLRRGRLFTVAIGDGALKPISAVDAFGPDIDPRSTWYDEMLVSEDTIAVIGYSYERGGTGRSVPNRREGNTARSATCAQATLLSRNYASRLIGSKLIFIRHLFLSVRERI